jgi:hypothetical protein
MDESITIGRDWPRSAGTGRRSPTLCRSAHAWDVAGAARAGCATAFVAWPGKVLDPLVERPEVAGADLAEVADAILVIDHGDERP